MLAHQNTVICSDAESLGVQTNIADAIVSNLTLQWCQNLKSAFLECHRILKPTGVFTFTTLTTDTLKELRNSWQQLDRKMHVNTFESELYILDTLKSSGFEIIETHITSIPTHLLICERTVKTIKSDRRQSHQ